MNYKTLILEKKEGMAKIILNRPEALNALNKQMREEILAACNEIETDDSIKALIFSGSGRAFCAGDDLKELKVSDEPFTARASRSSNKMQQAIERLSKPVIAAVHGYCYTGAFDIVLNCDIVIASDDAVFADTHARWGIFPGTGAAQYVTRLVGKMKAMELFLTCEPITAAEAERIGLINRVVPVDKLGQT